MISGPFHFITEEQKLFQILNLLKNNSFSFSSLKLKTLRRCGKGASMNVLGTMICQNGLWTGNNKSSWRMMKIIEEIVESISSFRTKVQLQILPLLIKLILNTLKWQGFRTTKMLMHSNNNHNNNQPNFKLIRKMHKWKTEKKPSLPINKYPETLIFKGELMTNNKIYRGSL